MHFCNPVWPRHTVKNRLEERGEGAGGGGGMKRESSQGTSVPSGCSYTRELQEDSEITFSGFTTETAELCEQLAENTEGQ